MDLFIVFPYFFQVQPKYLVEDFTKWGSLVRIITDNHFNSLVTDDKLLIIGYLVLLVLFLVVLGFWFWERGFNPKRLTSENIFFLVLGAPFIFLPFFANRFASLSAIFMAILVGHFWQSIFGEAGGHEFSHPTLSLGKLYSNALARSPMVGKGTGVSVGMSKIVAHRHLSIFCYILYVTCFILFFWRIIVIPPSVSAYQKANPYRDEAISFLNKNHLSGHMFNSLEDGGYFVWKDPARKIFMDGRLDVYTASGVYEDYKKIYDFPPKKVWQDIAKKYDLQIIILSGWQKEPMNTIRNSHLYNLVYWSDYLFILVKKDGVNKNYVASNSFNTIEPFKSEDYPKDKIDQVVSEYKQLKLLSPHSANIASSLAAAYQEKGLNGDAIAEYERSISIKPDDGAVRLALGNLYYANKKCDLASEQFDQAARIGTTIKAIAYRNLGIVNQDCLGDYALALYYFKSFLSEAKKTSLMQDQSLIQEANQRIWELQIRLKRGY